MKEYRTDDLIVYWQPEKCTHARECIMGQPAVFKPKQRPWINMAQGDAEDIIKTIDRCPTGALKYDLPEGSCINPENARGPGWINADAGPGAVVKINVMLNGPLVVKGNIQIFDPRGKLIESCSQAALCRCGHTNRRPYCDGSHVDHHWVGDC